MKLIINEKPHKVIAAEGSHIRNIGDIYEPEHKDEETGEIISEHIPYYTKTIYVPDSFTEKMMNELYIEEDDIPMEEEEGKI